MTQTSTSRIAIDKLEQEILKGNRAALGRAITLAESSLREHRLQAEELSARLLGNTGRSLRIAVSGIPGAGKSTFIERFGMELIHSGHRVAVLAIDPSSVRTGGSILGDKTRMQNLAACEHAFVRPSPTGGNLGGVAKRTRESLLLCEAAGFDLIIIETVGVGQSETAAAELADIFLLLAVPGTGDELQGIKRGILEIADIVAVNKTDGHTEASALKAAAEIRSALHILKASDQSEPPVLNTSGLTGKGLDELIKAIFQIDQAQKSTGGRFEKRAKQNTAWLWEELRLQAFEEIKAHPNFKTSLCAIEQAVAQGKLSAAAASRKIIRQCLKEHVE